MDNVCAFLENSLAFDRFIVVIGKKEREEGREEGIERFVVLKKIK